MDSTSITPKSSVRLSPTKLTPSAIDIVELQQELSSDGSDIIPNTNVDDMNKTPSSRSEAEESGFDSEGYPDSYAGEGLIEGSDEGSSGWDDQSLYEDMLGEQELDENENPDDTDASEICTPEESQYYRDLLRRVGSRTFVDETVSCGKISARKLITAFGLRPPPFLDGASDSAFFTLLGIMMQKELAKRRKLDTVNTVQDVVDLIMKSNNIMVVTGAGISTSLGIPDFRSKDNGLYARIDTTKVADPQNVFDMKWFRDDPSIFFDVAKDILPEIDRFTPTHAFIEFLQRKGKLLRNYTQNIDNIEHFAGVHPEKLVQCHGSFATATCQKCKYKCPGEEIFPDIRAKKIPMCPKCLAAKHGAGKKRKRNVAAEKPRKNMSNKWTDNTSEEDDWSYEHGVGIMKPDIIFFGEQLPDRFHRIIDHDRAKVDLLLCIGTSLKVSPVSDVPAFLPANVPQVFISRDPVHHIEFDVELIGDQCDEIIAELARRVGWGDEFKHEMISADTKLDVVQDAKKPSRHIFSKVKPIPTASTFSFTMTM